MPWFCTWRLKVVTASTGSQSRLTKSKQAGEDKHTGNVLFFNGFTKTQVLDDGPGLWQSRLTFVDGVRWGLRTVVAVACFPHFNICFASFYSMDTFSSVTLISFGSGIGCAFRSSLFLFPGVNVKPAFAVTSLNIMFTIKCRYFSSPSRVFHFLVFCSQLGNNIFFE